MRANVGDHSHQERHHADDEQAHPLTLHIFTLPSRAEFRRLPEGLGFEDAAAAAGAAAAMLIGAFLGRAGPGRPMSQVQDAAEAAVDLTHERLRCAADRAAEVGLVQGH